VPEKLIRSRKIFPVAFAWQGSRSLLVVVTSDPQNLIALDEVAFTSGRAVKAALASDQDIEEAIERHLGPAAKAIGAAGAGPGPTPLGTIVDMKQRAA
jgi:hypothetical protein